MTEKEENKFMFFLFVVENALNMKGNVSKFFLVIIKKHFQLQNMSSARYYRNCCRYRKCIFRAPEQQRNSPQKATSVSIASVYIHSHLRNSVSAHYASSGTCHSEDVNRNRTRFIDSSRYKGFSVKAIEFNRKENK